MLEAGARLIGLALAAGQFSPELLRRLLADCNRFLPLLRLPRPGKGLGSLLPQHLGQAGGVFSLPQGFRPRGLQNLLFPRDLRAGIF